MRLPSGRRRSSSRLALSMVAAVAAAGCSSPQQAANGTAG